jgi:hypothetical protein
LRGRFEGTSDGFSGTMVPGVPIAGCEAAGPVVERADRLPVGESAADRRRRQAVTVGHR